MFTPLGRVRTVDPMRQLRDGNGAQAYFPFPEVTRNSFKEIGDFELLAFRIERQSGSAGLRQCDCLRSNRPATGGVLMTATARLFCSTITSTPRTLARTA